MSLNKNIMRVSRMNSKIQRTSLQSEIIRYIQNYIQENGLKPGDRLPSQEKLIEMMGVSRTSLREAMKTLEARNVLEAKNGKGIYVGSQEVNNLLRLIDFAKEKELLLDTLEVRKILEREILRMVIHSVTQEELEELGAITRVLMAKFRRGEQQTAEDKKFHYTIYRLSHNQVMYQLILSISGVMDKFWEFPLNMEDPFLESLPLHEELYNAICEKNVKKAQAINERLLDAVYRDIRNQR
ncbi:GntR family transcriptional regulator [Enterocloster clostridioformis]|nr:GntR family transcriptional regulator [Lachnoclostridium sp. YL32]NDO32647.1 FadR family transcriptional regulator [Enterocloster clostridioformis]OXE62909.1 GntR family transcriptional regulator [Enterocloster clostridioformis]